MSYQENIYNQNGKCNRNFVGPVPTTSSDISVFNRPTFIMSGASSIDCPEATCSISGVPYNDLFTGTTDCYNSYGITGTCFNSVDWVTNVYEDDVLVYSNAFYSSTSLTGSVIDITTFSGSVVTAFDSLEYNYSFENEEFTIGGVAGVSNIKLELTTELDADENCQVYDNYTGDTSCSCPSGYTPTTGQDACEIVTYTAATYNGSDVTAIAGTPNSAYGVGGALFYSDITNDALPIRDRLAGSGIMDANSVNIDIDEQVQNSLWGLGSVGTGRLNAAGVWGVGIPNDEWVGFGYCLDIVEGGQYVIGIGGDDKMRFKLNGETIVNFLRNGNGFTHQYWYVFPITLTSGVNIIELEGLNEGSAASFAAEIYNAPIETLSGMTTEGELAAVTIFTTGDLVGTDFQLGETSGYSCPTGFTIDACYTGATRCTSIEREDITCIFTGECSTNDVMCDLDYSGITLNDSNVHLLTGQTEFDLTFEFTGNTETFPDTNAIFKYEIYKYLPDLNTFNNQAQYSSESFEWSTFSGTSAFTTSVSTESIDPDGEYLVKGHFIYDIGTEFANLLGYRNSTTRATTGEEYGLYQPSRDFYFVAFSEAQVPQLNNVVDDNPAMGNLTVSSIILDGEISEFNFPSTSSDYIISLNGITLAPGFDYERSVINLGSGEVSLVTLSGATISGDVLTYAYTSGANTNNLKSDTFDIDTPIVSGVTDGEGLNTVYYNSDTDKYEIFLSMTPESGNDIAITLNGVSLANTIDYYQSTSNPKRVIFEGDLIVSDIVNAYYNTNTNVLGPQSGTTMAVAWTIDEAPTTTNGLFTVEVSDDLAFSTIISSATTQHIIGATGYSIIVNLEGSVGDKQYYRIKNGKNFDTLCNERLTTEVYSEIANITIETNINNSY